MLGHITRPVHLYRARRAGEPTRDGRWVADPVCRMCLDVEQAATSVTHDGAEVFFCSAL